MTSSARQTQGKYTRTQKHIPENQVCADCGSTPTYFASVNLGVLFCDQCGQHHQLCPHVSLFNECTAELCGADEIERLASIGNVLDLMPPFVWEAMMLFFGSLECDLLYGLIWHDNLETL